MGESIRSMHYWRIHARVTKRLWGELSDAVRHLITCDDAHESENYKWFEKSVTEETERLYQDPEYHDNMKHTFRTYIF